MDLFTLLLIIWGVSKAISKNKNGKKQQKSKSIFDMDRAEQQRAAQAVGNAGAQKKPVLKPAPQQLSMLPPRPQPAQPRVHTHLAPDCEEHDRPGSLNFTSREGKDVCHEDMLAPAKKERPEVYAQEEPQGGLQLDWSGENMVKAFVMQEVLTRPCDRRRRA